MVLAKIIAAALITTFATGAMAQTTKCDHQGSNSLFANTNPPQATVKTATAGTTGNQGGTK